MTHSLTHKNLSVADLDFDHTAGSIGMNGTIYHCLPTLPQLLRSLGRPGCGACPGPDDGAGLPHRQRGQALQQFWVAPRPGHSGMAGASAHLRQRFLPGVRQADAANPFRAECHLQAFQENPPGSTSAGDLF